MQHPFHQYFRNSDADPQHEFMDPRLLQYKSYPYAKVLPLPKAAPLEGSLSRTLAARRSRRSFSPEPLPTPSLSQLLYWSAGVIGSRQEEGGNEFSAAPVRPHPSGGATYPVETYLVFAGNEELVAGCYHYRPDWHALEQITVKGNGSLQEMKTAAFSPWAEKAPLIIVLSTLFERTAPKYGTLAGKLALLECGHIAQNLYLGAAELQLACCAIGGFAFDHIDQMLHLDGQNETSCYALAIGSLPADAST